MRDQGAYARAFFQPQMAGLVRFLGERLYFLGLSSVFGANPLPFHICAFLTMFAAMWFLMRLVYRTTESEVAAGLAPLLWAVNSALAAPMTWISGYKETLCALMYLAGLWLLDRYLATGRTRYYVAQWAVFAAGFGASELLVAYPAVATLYCLCVYRRIPRSALALWLGSFAFLAVEFLAIQPAPRTGLYAPHFDGSMWTTFVKYWHTAAGPGRLYTLRTLGRASSAWLTITITAGVVATVWRTARERNWSGVFWLAWFVLTIAPVLPLRDHITDYLAATPAAGLGALAAIAFQRWRAVAVVWVGVYAITSAVGARTLSNSYHDHGERIRALAETGRDPQMGRPGTYPLLPVEAQPWTVYGRKVQEPGSTTTAVP